MCGPDRQKQKSSQLIRAPSRMFRRFHQHDGAEVREDADTRQEAPEASEAGTLTSLNLKVSEAPPRFPAVKFS